jgi:hypothetical protein
MVCRRSCARAVIGNDNCRDMAAAVVGLAGRVEAATAFDNAALLNRLIGRYHTCDRQREQGTLARQFVP